MRRTEGGYYGLEVDCPDSSITHTPRTHTHTPSEAVERGEREEEEDNATQSESPVAYMYMVLNIHAFERAAFVCCF